MHNLSAHTLVTLILFLVFLCPFISLSIEEAVATLPPARGEKQRTSRLRSQKP